MSLNFPGGKGSVQRPTDMQTYSANFDRIFGPKNKDKRPEGIPLRSDAGVTVTIPEASGKLLAANDDSQDPPDAA